MKLSDPINIMHTSCLPDKKKLMCELGRLSRGETIIVQIDNCVASRAIVESFLKNKWYSIVEVIDKDDSSILRIRMDHEV